MENYKGNVELTEHEYISCYPGTQSFPVPKKGNKVRKLKPKGSRNCNTADLKELSPQHRIKLNGRNSRDQPQIRYHDNITKNHV